MADINSITEQSVELSVATQSQPMNRGIGYLVFGMATQNSIISPWWSERRDIELRNFWKSVDHLAGTVYTMEAKLSSIPFKVLPKDQSNRAHVRQANDLTDILTFTPEYGDGWTTFFTKMIEDLLTSDNGMFAEIIGEGKPDGYLEGRPITISHLDSARCVRTGNKEFPVLYRADDGKLYKLHYTRVMYDSSMPSPIQEMNGVGFCSVSRALNVSQNILDILNYKMEKLGSRPSRAMIITKGGLDPEDIRKAFSIADAEMTNRGLSRFSKTVVVGDATLTEASVQMVDLAQLPDGFDEQTSMYLGIGAIALAFGMDVREIFPTIGAGSTRADAILQHIKQRGKAPGQIITQFERLFNHKFLPPHLYLSFDYQDDAQDRQVAETRGIRATGRKTNLDMGTMNIRTAREQMEVDGDLTHEQFVMLELFDGRLSDGSSILNLFYSNQKPFSEMLSLDVGNPFDYNNLDIISLEDAISSRTEVIRTKIANSADGTEKNDYLTCFYALMNLSKHYGITRSFPELEDEVKPVVDPPKPADPRVRTNEPTVPSVADTNITQEDMNPEEWNDTPSAEISRQKKKIIEVEEKMLMPTT